MAFKLVCTMPMNGFVKGQEVTDPVLIARLQVAHDHHFVAVPASQTPQQVVSTIAAAPTAAPQAE